MSLICLTQGCVPTSGHTSYQRQLDIILSLPILLSNPFVSNHLYVSNFPRERDAVIVIELSINLQHRLESVREENEEGPPRSSPRIAASDLQFP